MDKVVDLIAGGSLNYELEYVPCNLCGSDDHVLFLSGVKDLYNGFDEYFDIVRCRKCDFLFTNPRPSPDSMHVFYPDSAKYYKPKILENRNKESTVRKFRDRMEGSILANYLGYDLPRLPKFLDHLFYLTRRRWLRWSHIPDFVKQGRLLDVGCAWGEYLKRMRDLGWEVEGVELNGEAAKYARNDLGLKNVQVASFENAVVQDKTFNVVNMSMFLEHTHNPDETLKRANRILVNGGLLMISIPDIGGWETRIFKEYNYNLHVPQHISHFTPVTVRKFLIRNGFHIKDVTHYATVGDVLRSARYMDNKWLINFLDLSPVRNQILKPLLKILAILGRSGRMVVVAKKVGVPGAHSS